MVWHKDRKEKPNPTNLLKQYAIPKADQSEILIEKTPEIMNGNYKQLKQRAIIMKSIMPHVKFLGMILTSAQILVHWSQFSVAFVPLLNFRVYRENLDSLKFLKEIFSHLYKNCFWSTFEQSLASDGKIRFSSSRSITQISFKHFSGSKSVPWFYDIDYII